MKRVADMHVCAACALRAQLRGSKALVRHLRLLRFVTLTLRFEDAMLLAPHDSA